ncbi:MAG: hypothetical protein V4667_00340 [Bacteroidota bacterium]
MAQKCETFNRELFRMLPKDVPNEINCVDSLGRKQGWWIYYNVLFSEEVVFEEKPKGYYVKEYLIGKYISDRKTGEWNTVTQGHMGGLYKKENYFFTSDTAIYDLWHWRIVEAKISYNKDSTLIKSTIINPIEKDTVFINCDSRTKKLINNCNLYYQNKLISTFPDFKFDYEFYWAQDYLVREKYKRIALENSSK